MSYWTDDRALGREQARLDAQQEDAAAVIRDKQTKAGGWTKKQLAEWGIPWPPPKGWKKELENRGIRA